MGIEIEIPRALAFDRRTYNAALQPEAAPAERTVAARDLTNHTGSVPTLQHA